MLTGVRCSPEIRLPTKSKTGPASLDANTNISDTDASKSASDPEVAGVISGVSHISTSDLPDGVPEADLKDANDHKLGHMKSLKKTTES